MHLATSWPVWLAIVLGLALLGAVHFFYLKDIKGLKKKHKITLLALRSLVILILLAILIQIVIVIDLPPRKPTLCLLIDDSLSMDLKDSYGEGELGLFPALKEQNRISRMDIVNHFLAADWMEPLKEGCDLKYIRFSTNARPVPLGERMAVDREGFSTDLNRALRQVADEIDNLSAIALLSDGCWNRGADPLSAARYYAGCSTPVYTVGIGARELAPDIILSEVKCKNKIFLGDVAVAEITFKNCGFEGREVPLILKHDHEKIAEKRVTLKGGLKIQKEKFVFIPEKPDEMNLSLSIPFQQGEATEENNSKNFTLKVVEEKMKVFLAEEGARWEYRFLKNVLERDPNVQLNCLLYHGDKTASGDVFLSRFPDRNELNKYDVIILGDVSSSRFTAEELKDIILLVEEKGTALIIIGGKINCPYSFRNTPLEDIMPVALKKEPSPGHYSKSSFVPELTLEGKDHLMLQFSLDRRANIECWRSLSGGYWCAEVEKAKRGASVLAVHPYLSNVYGKLPLIVTQRRGSGKVLFMGIDSTWRWRSGTGDKYHYLFWGQVIRWLVRSRLMGDSPYVKMTISKDTYTLGEKVYLEAYVLDKDFFPMKDSEVFIVIGKTEGKEKVRLKPHPDETGLYRGEFLPKETGRYNMDALVPSLGEEAGKTKLQFDVEGGSAEVENISPDYKVLEKIAGITGGKFYTMADMSKLAQDISSAFKEKRLTAEYELWDSLLFLTVFVIIVTTEWILRKKWGLA